MVVPLDSPELALANDIEVASHPVLVTNQSAAVAPVQTLAAAIVSTVKHQSRQTGDNNHDAIPAYEPDPDPR
ncbi:hypothetical protein [Lentzea cavernae]|uniref:Uncharacterized protein n=1 Tax=Lentzea cavernae TaxID=2020703 RepID=A0ABQ3MFC5_9PSEU|nr:hypothetical protein [Lentzea cavernae]GHH43786.1 hypothetical protein GCM10017774_41930 [Lentzea cavernae]